MGKASTINGPFSIAMFVYQRVHIINKKHVGHIEFIKMSHQPWKWFLLIPRMYEKVWMYDGGHGGQYRILFGVQNPGGYHD
jgi:hypothetical protein